jgi:hypothetical protein
MPGATARLASALSMSGWDRLRLCTTRRRAALALPLLFALGPIHRTHRPDSAFATRGEPGSQLRGWTSDGARRWSPARAAASQEVRATPFPLVLLIEPAHAAPWCSRVNPALAAGAPGRMPALVHCPGCERQPRPGPTRAPAQMQARGRRRRGRCFGGRVMLGPLALSGEPAHAPRSRSRVKASAGRAGGSSPEARRSLNCRAGTTTCRMAAVPKRFGEAVIAPAWSGADSAPRAGHCGVPKRGRSASIHHESQCGDTHGDVQPRRCLLSSPPRRRWLLRPSGQGRTS